MPPFADVKGTPTWRLSWGFGRMQAPAEADLARRRGRLKRGSAPRSVTAGRSVPRRRFASRNFFFMILFIIFFFFFFFFFHAYPWPARGARRASPGGAGGLPMLFLRPYMIRSF